MLVSPGKTAATLKFVEIVNQKYHRFFGTHHCFRKWYALPVVMQVAFSRKVEKAQDLIEKHIRDTTTNLLQHAKDVLDKAQ